MAELKDRLRADLNSAMRARDQVRLRTLRMALTSITNEEVSGAAARDLTDDELFWEPLPGSWSVRRRSDCRTPTPHATSDDDWLKKSDLAVTFLDRYGNEVGNRGIKHNESVPLDQFPDHLIKAVLSTEDRRFYEHFGIDFFGLPIFAVFYGLDWIATVPPTVRLATDVFGKERAPIIFGWVVAGHQLGAAFAAFGAGLLRSSLGTYTVASMISGGLCLIASFLVLRINRRSREVGVQAA